MTHQRLREKAEDVAYSHIHFGDEFMFSDISAAVVAADGLILRTINGQVMTPGTKLWAMPNNEHPGEIIKELLAELDAARKDAERYRWLRKMYRASSPHMDGTFEHRPPMHAFRGRTLDDAIDAALNADGEKSND